MRAIMKTEYLGEAHVLGTKNNPTEHVQLHSKAKLRERQETEVQGEMPQAHRLEEDSVLLGS